MKCFIWTSKHPHAYVRSKILGWIGLICVERKKHKVLLQKVLIRKILKNNHLVDRKPAANKR